MEDFWWELLRGLMSQLGPTVLFIIFICLDDILEALWTAPKRLWRALTGYRPEDHYDV